MKHFFICFVKKKICFPTLFIYTLVAVRLMAACKEEIRRLKQTEPREKTLPRILEPNDSL